MLNKCGFCMVSYSPVTKLLAEHLTEAYMVASFSGQLNSPSQLISKKQKTYLYLAYHFKVKGVVKTFLHSQNFEH